MWMVYISLSKDLGEVWLNAANIANNKFSLSQILYLIVTNLYEVVSKELLPTGDLRSVEIEKFHCYTEYTFI